MTTIVSTQHLDYLERSYLDGTPPITGDPWLALAGGTLQLVHITSIPRPPAALHPLLAAHSRMGESLAGLHSQHCSLVYVIYGTPTAVRLYMGLAQHDGSGSNPRSGGADASLVAALLESMYPGMAYDPMTAAAQERLQDALRAFPEAAIVTGTPAIDTDAEAHGGLRDPMVSANASTPACDLQIDRLIRALRRTSWAYVAVAVPVDPQAVATLAGMALNTLRLVADAEQSVRTAHPIAGRYSQQLQSLWGKLQTGKAQGMWHSMSYLLGQDPPTLQRAKAISRAIFSDTTPRPDPIRVLSAPGAQARAAALALPGEKPP